MGITVTNKSTQGIIDVLAATDVGGGPGGMVWARGTVSMIRAGALTTRTVYFTNVGNTGYSVSLTIEVPSGDSNASDVGMYITNKTSNSFIINLYGMGDPPAGNLVIHWVVFN